MADTSDFRNGLVIEMEGALFSIVEFQHVKPGKGGAFVRTKLKNVETGRVIDKTFRAGEKVQEVRLETREFQYLYQDGDHFYFMNNETFEQVPLARQRLEDALPYLKENDVISVLMRDEEPITVEVANFVELKITKTDPGVKGDTAAGGSKPATMETGVVVQVPLFLEEGDIVRIDTRTGKYVTRV
jgi:elongation factor P